MDLIYKNYNNLKGEGSVEPMFLEIESKYNKRANLFIPSVDQDKDGFSPKFNYMSQNNINIPMVNTDTNFFDIVNTGQKFIAYGKALLPPHPEDLFPGFPCCMMFPCVEKPPCNDDDLRYLLNHNHTQVDDMDKKIVSSTRFKEIDNINNNLY